MILWSIPIYPISFEVQVNRKCNKYLRVRKEIVPLLASIEIVHRALEQTNQTLAHQLNEAQAKLDRLQTPAVHNRSQNIDGFIAFAKTYRADIVLA